MFDKSDVTARRYALGIRVADARTAEKIVEVTGGAVTIEGLHRTRLAFLAGRKPDDPIASGEAA
ncbi:hypothetical protein [Microvirga solisilvae]|uniref:hypothetical protein n=1 Tax=Microvirga solisilvae TaxID=2919498 RepID=UPI001FB037F1|nr:hypothetical protein [Microvirga solisilvae]